MKRFAFLALCFLSPWLRGDPLELTGLLTSREKGALAVITDKADGAVSPWLSEGHVWRGYRITTISVADNAVVLGKDGVNTTLQLREARVEKGAARATSGFKLLKGSATQSGARLTYSPDTVIQVGDLQVTARAGNMESEGAWVIGDLTVQGTGKELPAASVGVNGARVRISSQKVQLPLPPPEFEPRLLRPE